MNILVTGANGQLGREMRIVSEGSQDRYHFSDIADAEGLETLKLDITDLDALTDVVTELDIRCIINCAAFTNVDAAEDNFELAERLNADAPAKLAAVMAEVGGLLVHISTDYVFGGAGFNSPIPEDAAPNPTGAYGVTKLHGEQKIIASGCRYVIVRTAWLYSEFGKNFVKTMMKLTSERPVVKVVNDQIGTPTYALDLARLIFKIVSGNLYDGREGIYHFSDEGVCSWYDFASKIAAQAGNKACDVQPCTSAEFPSKVVRPPYSVLDKSKVKDAFGFNVPKWESSLETCMKNMLGAE